MKLDYITFYFTNLLGIRNAIVNDVQNFGVIVDE